MSERVGVLREIGNETGEESGQWKKEKRFRKGVGHKTAKEGEGVTVKEDKVGCLERRRKWNRGGERMKAPFQKLFPSFFFLFQSSFKIKAYPCGIKQGHVSAVTQ